MKHLSAIILALCLALTAAAQNNNPEKKGSVTVTQESAITDLVNNNASQTAATQSGGEGSSTGAEATEGGSSESSGETKPRPASDRPKASSSTDKHGKLDENGDDPDAIQRRDDDYKKSTGINGPKIMKGTARAKGWRLQVYNGGNKRKDREAAEEAGKKVKKKFPGMPVYVHFNSPRWQARCGDFRTHKEAEPMKKELIKMGFKNACIVRAEITVDEKRGGFKR